MPLLTNEAAEKFGKSTSAPIWLDLDKTSSFDFYQFFMRVTDKEIPNLLRLFTFLPLNVIEQIENSIPNSKPNTAQKRLAELITLLVHGGSLFIFSYIFLLFFLPFFYYD